MRTLTDAEADDWIAREETRRMNERTAKQDRWERWWSVAMLGVLAVVAGAGVYAAYWLREIAEVLATK